MKLTRLTQIFGILFGISLFVVSYICLPVGIVLAFADKGDFGYMIYVFAGLAIATIVGASLAKKSILTSRIILSLSTLVVIATTIYLASIENFSSSPAILLLFIADILLGIIPTLFSFFAKPKKAVEQDSLLNNSQKNN